MAAGIVPPALMCTFGILVIRSRRQLHARLNRSDRNGRRDHALLVMLMSEVVVYIVTTILYPAVTLPSTNRWTIEESRKFTNRNVCRIHRWLVSYLPQLFIVILCLLCLFSKLSTRLQASSYSFL
jgi:hypothetical protein